MTATGRFDEELNNLDHDAFDSEKNEDFFHKCLNCGHILTSHESDVVEWMNKQRCPRCYTNTNIMLLENK